MGGEIKLTMGDGSTRVITLERGQDVIDVYRDALDKPETPTARLIAESVSAIEPGGGRLIELARAILNSPADPEPEFRNLKGVIQ
jgi:hypothetical protein